MTDNKKGVNPAAVGLAGAIIGAAAGAAAVALSDKDNRKKLQKTVDQIKTEGSKRIEEIKKRVDEGAEDVQEKLEEAKDKAENSEKATKK